MISKIAISILFFCCSNIYMYAQSAGAPDLSFASDGVFTSPLGEANAFGQSVQIQKDGKIIVAGISNNGTNTDFTLMRLNPNGEPDVEFAENGVRYTDFNGRSDIAQSSALDELERIIVAGYIENGNGFDFGISRYLANGELDEAFGNDGLVTTSFGFTAFAKSVAIQNDGKIVVGGFGLNPVSSTNEFIVTRYLEDGTLDSSFHHDGKVFTNMLLGAGVANAMLIQPDGKIVLAGQVFNEGTFSWEIGVARFLADGNLDQSWDDDGRVFTSTPLVNHTTNAITIDQHGKVVVGGYQGTAPSNNKFTLMRYNSDGTSDHSFGDEGMVTGTFGFENNQITSLVTQPDGNILLGGTTLIGNADRFAIARVDHFGNLTSEFGDGGIVVPVIGQNDGIKSMALQQDGKLVVSGESFDGLRFLMAVARYETGLPTNVRNVNIIKELFVYPNPVSETLNVECQLMQPSQIDFNLYDNAGHLILPLSQKSYQDSGSFLESIKLPLDLPSGIYNLQLATRQGAVTKQIIVN